MSPMECSCCGSDRIIVMVPQARPKLTACLDCGAEGKDEGPMNGGRPRLKGFKRYVIEIPRRRGKR